MNKITTTPFETETEQWESGVLGRDEAYVAVAPKSSVLDDALDLQMISIRLPKELIETFKFIANANGMGYQPLMRTTLQRFADNELKLLGRAYLDKMQSQALQEAQANTAPAPVLKMAA